LLYSLLSIYFLVYSHIQFLTLYITPILSKNFLLTLIYTHLYLLLLQYKLCSD